MDCEPGHTCRYVGRYGWVLERLEIIISSSYMDHFYGVPGWWVFNHDACKQWHSL